MVEFNIDGLIGPTHHFGGLGVGNIASAENRWRESNPQGAAFEGLAKMERLAELGVPQVYLPPVLRPDWEWLRRCGLAGSKTDILKKCFHEFPQLLSAAFSSAFMWTANAATVSASTDTQDSIGRIAIANLSSSLHRENEGTERFEQLKHLFAKIPSVEVRRPLPASYDLRDEGAANGMRFCSSENAEGLYVFVYGAKNLECTDQSSPSGSHRPARQTLLASRLVAQSLGLPDDKSLYIQQSTEAIDAGAFHNDVIATSHQDFLLMHQFAFADQNLFLDLLEERHLKVCERPLRRAIIGESELSLRDAIRTYFFNSQIVTLPDGRWLMLCPRECESSQAVQRVIQKLLLDLPELECVEYVPLSESMANGGGPACLRLRAYLHKEELSRVAPNAFVFPEIADKVRNVLHAEYPKNVSLSSFADIQFAEHAEAISRKLQALWY